MKNLAGMRKRSSITTRMIRSVDNLSDDNLIEIFLRLPVDCVHRFRCVSKRWLNLTSTFSFVDSFIRLRTNSTKSLNPNRLDDFLVYQQYDPHLAGHGRIISHVELKPSSDYSPKTEFFDFPLRFLPVLQNRKRPHIHHRHCSCKRGLRTRSETLRFFNLLRISKGLMLCEAGLLYNSHVNSHVFYVCDPLTKQWLELPPSPWSGHHGSIEHRPIGFMFTETIITVICVDFHVNHSQCFKIHVFSSKAGTANSEEWRTFWVPFPPGYSRPNRAFEVVVCKERFHWNCNTIIVVYDPLRNPSRCDSICIPAETTSVVSSSGPHIAVTGGCLRLYDCRGVSESYNHFWYIWDLVDYDKCKWSTKYKIVAPSGCFSPIFSETNSHAAFYISSIGTNVMVCYISMDGNVVLCKSVRKYTDTPEKRFLPYVMTLWPTSISNFNSSSTIKEEET